MRNLGANASTAKSPAAAKRLAQNAKAASGRNGASPRSSSVVAGSCVMKQEKYERHRLLRARLLRERASVAGRRADDFFDAQQLVVFTHAISAAGRTGFDLPRAERYGKVGDRGVLGFAGAMADHRRVAGASGHLHAVDCFGQRADLVYLDQDAVGDSLFDPLLKALHVGHEDVVSNELALGLESIREQLPTFPVVFGTAILDRADGVLGDEAREELDHGGRMG